VKRRSLVVHATVIAAGAVVAVLTAMFTAPPAAVVVIGACFVAIDVAALLVVNRLDEARKVVAALETDVWILSSAVADVNTLAVSQDPDAGPAATRVFLNDVNNLIGPALRRMNRKDAK
jgi:hypothetical protein